MRSRLTMLGITLALAVSLFSPAAATAAPTWQVFASGLYAPRGLRFGPDGALYVAEGGLGGTKTTTSHDCEQVPDPSGPYSGGMTARISRLDANGKRTTVIDKLPSTQTSAQSGSDISGVSAVAFLDGTLYATIAGAGCSHGNKGTVNALLQIGDDGKATQVADLSSFYMANPVKASEEDDFEPDGDVYSMIQVDGNFYVLEANHGELDKITPEGKITRVIDISASQGHVVPTALAYHDGAFYVGTLSLFPVHTGTARIYKITPDGEISVLAPHLTAILGLAFDDQGQLYALETTTTDKNYPTPRSGTVVRVQPDSEKVDVIASGLTFPTALTFGPDGKLYVSNYGYGVRAERGEIVRLMIPPA